MLSLKPDSPWVALPRRGKAWLASRHWSGSDDLRNGNPGRPEIAGLRLAVPDGNITQSS